MTGLPNHEQEAMQLTLRATRNTSRRRFALGKSNACLVGENPTCSVPSLQGLEGIVWSYDDRRAQHVLTWHECTTRQPWHNLAKSPPPPSHATWRYETIETPSELNPRVSLKLLGISVSFSQWLNSTHVFGDKILSAALQPPPHSTLLPNINSSKFRRKKQDR